MPLMRGSKTYDPVDNFNTAGGVDIHPAIGLYYASPTGHVLVSPTNPLPVDATVVIGPSSVLTHTATQNLALGSLNTTTAFANTHKPSFVALHFSAPLPADQTLVITFNSGSGAAFDTIVVSITLAANTQDYIFFFPASAAYSGTDETTVTLTNTGTPAVTVSVTVQALS